MLKSSLIVVIYTIIIVLLAVFLFNKKMVSDNK